MESGEWVYGSLVTYPNGRCEIVVFDDGEILEYEVDAESVGQFTGLIDKNGNEIYEGDVITQYLVLPNYRNARRGQVLFDKLWCFILLSKGRLHHLFGDGVTQEVQGNIHDNPNLLNDAND